MIKQTTLTEDLSLVESVSLLLEEDEWKSMYGFCETWLPLEILQVDYENYQRLPVRRVVEDIKKRFSWHLFGRLRVMQREDGSYWVNDGQNRKTAIEELGYKGMVPCFLMSSAGVVYESNDFLDVNESRAHVDPLSRFWAGVSGLHEDKIVVKRIIERHGLHVLNVKDRYKGGIKAIDSCLKIYKWHGEAVLDQTLEAYMLMFEGNTAYLKQDLIFGLGKAITDMRRKEGLHYKRLIEKIQKVGWKGLHLAALMAKKDSGCAMGTAFTAAFRNLYNHGIKENGNLVRWE